MIYAVFLAHIFMYILFVRRRKFNSYNLSMILMFICFALVPTLLHVIEIPSDYYKGWIRGIPAEGYNETIVVSVMLMSLFGVLIYGLSYKSFVFKEKGSKLATYQDGVFYLLFGWFVFFVGVISFLIYLKSFGSIAAGFLGNERLVYTGEYSRAVSSVSFFKTIAQLMIVGTYIIWGANKILNKSNKFVFLLPLAVSFIYLYYLSGRQSIIVFFAVFYFFDNTKDKNKYLNIRSMLFLLFAIVFMVFGKPIFKYFLDNESINASINRASDQGPAIVVFLDFIGEFSFPLRSMYYAIENHSDLKFNYFKDLFFSFTYAFPEKLVPSVESTAMFNTRNVFGDYVEVASQPSDIFTYGILNLSYLGILITSVLFGFLTKWLDSFNFDDTNPVFRVLFIYFTFVVGFRVMYFDPKHFVKGQFFFLVVLLILFFNRKMKRRQ